VDRFWADYDRDTRRAILKLYRASPPETLADAGRGLGNLRCPTLILWATGDPYLGAGLGRQYADALGGEVELEMVENAGHWLWLDRPELIERAARFLEG
jgi:pimeloyl-ACP methyl ester carboxylesterase